ncbi:hypothetical protein GCM10010094_67410 [Streptomyces flaveus]|uniref:Deoxyribodipyrimidine photo-lyase n=1 Tax=Streptomyces flaveus TaxID=66370 RepID=A0A917R9G1_9ACTN|nr:hypothetical protein GCM10010094_67410 [Streptomyces flaveus]
MRVCVALSTADLRVYDNPVLQAALRDAECVVPLFVRARTDFRCRGGCRDRAPGFRGGGHGCASWCCGGSRHRTAVPLLFWGRNSGHRWRLRSIRVIFSAIRDSLRSRGKSGRKRVGPVRHPRGTRAVRRTVTGVPGRSVQVLRHYPVVLLRYPGCRCPERGYRMPHRNRSG